VEKQQLCYFCLEYKPITNPTVCPFCGVDDQEISIYSQRIAAYSLSVGSLLEDRYRIGRVLGAGEFDVTYFGYDSLEQRKVVVKEFFSRKWVRRGADGEIVLVTSESAMKIVSQGLEAIDLEMRGLIKVRAHDALVQVFQVFRANQTIYSVHEYVDGYTLEEYLDLNTGKLSWSEAERIFEPIMEGLERVHEVGLIHGDLQPSRILISVTQQVKLFDFGAARFLLAAASGQPQLSHTPGFTAPEQYQLTSSQGIWSDIYGLAATMYRVITGITPPSASDRFFQDPLQAPRQLGISLDERVERALLKALSVRSADRFATMDEFRKSFARGTAEERAQQLLTETFVAWQTESQSQKQLQKQSQKQSAKTSFWDELQKQEVATRSVPAAQTKSSPSTQPVAIKHTKLSLLFRNPSIYWDFAVPWFLCIELMKYFMSSNYTSINSHYSQEMQTVFYIISGLLTAIVLLVIYMTGKQVALIRFRILRWPTWILFAGICLHLAFMSTYYHFQFFIENQKIIQNLYLTIWHEPIRAFWLEIVPNITTAAAFDMMLIAMLSSLFFLLTSLLRFHLFAKPRVGWGANRMYFSLIGMYFVVNGLFVFYLQWLTPWFIVANGTLITLAMILYLFGSAQIFRPIKERTL
jgi:serine/threonine protein kinase